MRCPLTPGATTPHRPLPAALEDRSQDYFARCPILAFDEAHVLNIGDALLMKAFGPWDTGPGSAFSAARRVWAGLKVGRRVKRGGPC